MTLTPIGDIGTLTLTQADSPLVWETASDWDSNSAEGTVVHEGFGDLPGDGVIQLGFPSFDKNGTDLYGFWPFDEDSGSTAEDVSGNNRDGTIRNVTTGVTGALGTSAYEFARGDSQVDLGTGIDLGAGDITWSVMFKTDDLSTTRYLFAEDNEYTLAVDWGGAKKTDAIWLGSFGTAFTSDAVSWSTNTWYHLVVTYDDSTTTAYFYRNGTSIGSFNGGTPISNDNSTHYIGDRAGNPGWEGVIDFPRIYRRRLGDNQATSLDPADGFLKTATKTFNSAQKPNFDKLDYTTNGERIDLRAIGSPDTASEEIVEVENLDGSTSYSLSWSNSHTDFQLDIQLFTNDYSTSPTFNRGALAP